MYKGRSEKKRCGVGGGGSKCPSQQSTACNRSLFVMGGVFCKGRSQEEVRPIIIA
jgi:hypothetical protein